MGGPALPGDRIRATPQGRGVVSTPSVCGASSSSAGTPAVTRHCTNYEGRPRTIVRDCVCVCVRLFSVVYDLYCFVFFSWCCVARAVERSLSVKSLERKLRNGRLCDRDGCRPRLLSFPPMRLPPLSTHQRNSGVRVLVIYVLVFVIIVSFLCSGSHCREGPRAVLVRVRWQRS